MATAAIVASASSPLADTAPLKKYDVFISFRGEDTRDNFTSHLHAALCRNKIETYIDNRLDKGEEVWPALVEAIQDSSIFLVIFSKNYASSTWCLNELVEIMECKKEGQHVIPVFFRINPSHVRKQTGSYQTAFAKHEKDFKRCKDKVLKWKAALLEAANIVGFDSGLYRTESDLVEDIIKAVLQKLNFKYPYELRGHFILDQNYSQIISLLSIKSREVQIIGIWGMGGIGKTTIATVVFHKLSSQYEGSCFLANVSEESKRHGLSYICSRLLSKLLREDIHIDTPKVISSTVMRRLKRKKVFIVLDDVNTSELLENLIGRGYDWLGAGSKVIVTTRDKHVLISRGVDEIHEVKKMNFQDSLLLFSLNAFNKTYPEQGYEELSKRAVVYAKGIPLALKVLGSFLCSKSQNEWDSALTKLKKVPNAEIQKVLGLSYDELDDTEKSIFLDIACFFKGHKRDQVTRILNACGFFADIGIRNLLDKAFIAITSDNDIQMHDLIQEMGQKFVSQESKNPGGRSRLWDSEEVYDVLKNNKGTNAVESIFLDLNEITDLHLSFHAFRKMPNLRLLAFNSRIGFEWKRFSSMCPPMDLELPNSLRYIYWDGYPLKSLPSTFCLEKLVELYMQHSNMKKLWNGEQNLPNLEKIDLWGSKCLIECPDLSGAPNLKSVILGHCESLVHVHPSIFTLHKLEELNVNGCKMLKSLCSNNYSPSLKRLFALDCSELQEFPVTLMPRDHSTTHLFLGDTALNELPSTILDLKNLEKFYFPISDSLMNLPENFAYEIWLSDSKKLEHDALTTLHTLLPCPGFRYVRRLVLDNCHTLSELPNNISLLSSLEDLFLKRTRVISLPESIKYLPQLKSLDVSECEMLQSVPALPQSIQCFDASNCISLKKVLSSMSEAPKKHKGTFLFLNCMKLDQDAYNTILKDAIIRIELGAKSLSTMLLRNKEDAYIDDNDDDEETNIFETVKSGKICYFLPTTNGKFQDWFNYSSTQSLISIELPPNSQFLGFIFYFVLSQVQVYHMNEDVSFGCECYLETSYGEKVDLRSFFIDKGFLYYVPYLLEIMSDHVFLWYDAQFCKQIMEAIEERKAIHDEITSYNPKLTFKFFAKAEDGEEGMIKECGLRWIYPLEDQIVNEREGCNEQEELVEGSKSNEQEELVPSTKKFSQNVFGTPSNLEVEEVEDLRLLLEELLHIGFIGDLK